LLTGANERRQQAFRNKPGFISTAREIRVLSRSMFPASTEPARQADPLCLAPYNGYEFRSELV